MARRSNYRNKATRVAKVGVLENGHSRTAADFSQSKVRTFGNQAGASSEMTFRANRGDLRGRIDFPTRRYGILESY